ncbi:hypothetical protein [Solimonas soli]|uniref:hypothetical protein n=1 Tax=Solimonas soli TaxID=413479 RepID=UPI0004806A18|nr:hypothetical protein [Solimonas soli]
MSRPLPAIRIDVAAPAADAVLPRMDIAVFVGFASTGPLHRPVPVESIAQYAAVFGADAPLAFDAQSGQLRSAYLGPAVRAFFGNGGRRCWVIRVARCAALAAAGADASAAQLARYNRFALPGLLALKSLSTTPGCAAAEMLARCEGSWSDGLRVATALQAQGFTLAGLHHAGAPNQYRFRSGAALAAGDLIAFADPAVADPARGRQVYAVVLAVDDEAGTTTAALRAARLVRVQCCAAFQPLAQTPAAARNGVLRLPGASNVPATLIEEDGAVRIAAQAPRPATTLQPGQWAVWRAPGETVWLRADTIEFAAAPGPLLRGPAWRLLADEMPLPLAGVRRAVVLQAELRVAEGDDAAQRRTIGLTPAHAQSWCGLSTDAVFYGEESGGDASARLAELQRRVALGARFPLAADAAQPAAALLPLGVESLFGASSGARRQTRTALERDGLSRFDAALFVDPALAQTGLAALAADAEQIAYTAAQPRALFGLHAALGLGHNGVFDEATLIAIPDLVHGGWERFRPQAPPPAAAAAPAVPPQWRTHRGACAPGDDEALRGPDRGRFLDCATLALDAPALGAPARVTAPAAIALSWTAVAGAGVQYVLEEALLNDFADAREIYRGPALQFDALDRPPANYYYRVHSELADERSADSNAVAVACIASEWRALAPGEYAPRAIDTVLVSVQRALLRCCAASGDLLAALALPQHYRKAEAVRHADRLRAPRSGADAQAFAFDERRALSYGALFHPWLAYGRWPDTPRLLPPDGAVLGSCAALAERRGAWIAAANRSLRDVIALAPELPDADWQDLLDAQVNLLRGERRGFAVMGSDTLADDSELRPLNVRRLLILLRRLALREGATYVFEPNGDLLKRAVRRGFERLLSELFRRGAFAGATPAQSYQIVLDGGLDTQADQDNGRLLVELRVAPSLPLRFLAVRLQQSGERLTVAEGA